MVLRGYPPEEEKENIERIEKFLAKEKIEEPQINSVPLQETQTQINYWPYVVLLGVLGIVGIIALAIVYKK